MCACVCVSCVCVNVCLRVCAHTYIHANTHIPRGPSMSSRRFVELRSHEPEVSVVTQELKTASTRTKVLEIN